MRRKCFIVGGGPSLKGFPFGLLYKEDVIAVNQSIFQIPTAKYFITMDYTWLRKSLVQISGPDAKGPRHQYFVSLPTHKVFVVAIPPERRKKLEDATYIDTQFDLQYRLDLFDQVVECYAYGGLSTNFDDFRVGSDSGFSALQLASLIGYDDIYLLGMDFSSDNGFHYHKDYPAPNPQRYSEVLNEFVIPYKNTFELMERKGIRVFSCSPISKLNSLIPFCHFEEALNR